ncbi:MAG: acyl carrier protein [Candidatus Omnitrophota bacterium]
MGRIIMADINVEQTVKEILASQLNVDINTIKNDSRMAEDLNLDSFGAVELVFALEEKFVIKISDQSVYTAKTVQDIIDYVASVVAPK